MINRRSYKKLGEKNQAHAKSRLVSFRVLRTQGVKVCFALELTSQLLDLSMSMDSYAKQSKFF